MGGERSSGAAWHVSARVFGVVLVAAPLAVFTAILFADGVPGVVAAGPGKTPAAQARQIVSARFSRCIGGARHTCVVDGDTIWLEGTKIRIADIDAPEISQPSCEAERIVGERATERLTRWLNAGAFEVHPNPEGRDTDRYGRKLHVLARNGESAVEALAAHGVASRWGGRGKNWC
ncbi:thermonuclease family protein [Citromicrobium bathyomarinum]|uniref:thermonuclease family protein n=1 Tax=Citromicrobium bathyomarinum TaxID=72174 RepID=UPI00315ADE72